MSHALIVIIGLLLKKKPLISCIIYALQGRKLKSRPKTSVSQSCEARMWAPTLYPGARDANFTQVNFSPWLPGWYWRPDIILEKELEQNNQVDAF